VVVWVVGVLEMATAHTTLDTGYFT